MGGCGMGVVGVVVGMCGRVQHDAGEEKIVA